MAEYYVAECPVRWKIYRVEEHRDVAVTEAMVWSEAQKMLCKIKLLDPPAQKELDLWR